MTYQGWFRSWYPATRNKPDINVRQRVRLNASLKNGLLSTISARALNVEAHSSLNGFDHHSSMRGEIALAVLFRSAS